MRVNDRFTFLLTFLLFTGVNHISLAQKDDTSIDAKEKSRILKEYKQWTAKRDDWPNLKRYQAANNELGKPKENEKRVVFMGNSITDGWINSSPDFFRGNPFVDRGISGQTTPQMLVRFRQDVIDLEPEIVVILAGTNDIAGNTGPSSLEMIEDNLASMAEIANAHGIKVVLCSVLPVYDYPWRPGLEPAQKIVELNRWIRRYSEDHNMIYLDYFSAMVDDRLGLKANYSYDGVHPNKKGYAVMEGLVLEAVKKALP